MVEVNNDFEDLPALPEALALVRQVKSKEKPEIHPMVVDGITFHLPMVKKKFLAWKCVPGCGRCCRPVRLMVVPNDIRRFKDAGQSREEIMKKLILIEKKGKAGMYLKRSKKDSKKTIDLPMTCQYLQEDLNCGIRETRPFTCRHYPFSFAEKSGQVKNLGYELEALEVCPGFYLTDDPEVMRPVVEEEISEIRQANLQDDEILRAEPDGSPEPSVTASE